MTEISRKIEISAAKEQVWAFIQPDRWTEIFEFVSNVQGQTDGQPGVGTKATVAAGGEISYSVEITDIKEMDYITYRREGSFVSGSGKIEIESVNSGTVLKRTAQYSENLAPDTIKALGRGMENDNRRIKAMVEQSK